MAKHEANHLKLKTNESSSFLQILFNFAAQILEKSSYAYIK